MATSNVERTERWASSLGGAALLVAGARRLADDRPGQAALLSAVGAGLIWHGGSMSTDRADVVEVAVSINCPADELSRAWRHLGVGNRARVAAIRFIPEGDDRGTVVSVRAQNGVPGGKIGTALATIFGKEPSQMLREELRRFKQIMEAGEVPTIDGQPRGGR